VEVAVIVDLPSSSAREVSRTLLRLRNEVGAMAMGRVLTLLVAVDEDGADEAVRAANDATRQHPARIVVVVSANSRGRGRLDAQIRVGGDAGASEIVVLRLYGELTRHGAAVVTPLLLPDSPVVCWWPTAAPADVAGSALGAMAHRRITDVSTAPRPAAALRRRSQHYRPGDTDLAWTRVTRWRALLAASLEAEPFAPVTGATVVGAAECASSDLLAGWLAWALRCPVHRVRSGTGTDVVSVRLDREPGPIDLVRTDDGADTATLTRAGSLPRLVALHSPTLPGALADELRRLDPDEIYAAALREGLPQVRRGGTRSDAARSGQVPRGPAPVDTSARAGVASSRLTGPPPPDRTDQGALAARVEDRLHSLQQAQVRGYEDPEVLGAAVAAELDRRVTDAVQARGIAHVVLTGGSMGAATARALAALAEDGQLDPGTWRAVHLWWGDERFVPAGHPDRNDQQADDAGLTRVPVLRKHLHRVPGGEGPRRLGEAAARYAAELAGWAPAPTGGEPHVPVPMFDVVMLGLGPDTHVASLFPDRAELGLRVPTTAAVTDSPKPPPLRVTLTVPALSHARSVWFVVAGADKAEALTTAMAARDDHAVPASCVRGRQETTWWVDRAAGGSLVGPAPGGLG
jgi:glucose-6-phosphate dehydrogenase assembly protein OpcA